LFFIVAIFFIIAAKLYFFEGRIWVGENYEENYENYEKTSNSYY